MKARKERVVRNKEQEQIKSEKTKSRGKSFNNRKNREINRKSDSLERENLFFLQILSIF